MTPRFFRTQQAFREWLAKNGAKADELLVGFHKVGTGKGGLTYKGAVDEALCHGWIDGVRRSLGDEGYTIRFTPRRKTSIWSNVNIKRAQELIAEGKMTAPGLAEFERRAAHRSGVYSFESAPRELSAARGKRFRANKKAWAFWEKQPPGYRRTASFWVESAKREETRERRLAQLISDSAGDERLAQLTWKPKPKNEARA